MYAIVFGVSSKILALPDFFFDPVMFGNTWCVVCCCPRSPPSIFPVCVPNRLLSRTVTPTLYSCSPSATLPTANPTLPRRRSERGRTLVGPYLSSHAPPLPNSRHPSLSPQRTQPSSPLSAPSTCHAR